MVYRRRQPKGRRRISGDDLRVFLKPSLAIVGLVAIVVIGSGLVLGYQTIKAKTALQPVGAQAQRLQAQVSAGDVSSARATLRDLEASTEKAQSITAGKLWDVGGHAPFVGDSLDAVQTVSQVLSQLSKQGLQPIVDAAASVDPKSFSPDNGQIDIDSIEKLAPALTTAARSLESSKQQLAPIDADNLIGALKGPITELKSKLSKAESTAAAGSTAARVMPDMLGGSKPRTYLLVIQNNAELRSTGGLPGAFAIIKADNGKISLTKQGAGSEFGYFDKPVVKLSEDETNLYSSLMVTYWSDANFTPDFPRVGQIMRAMYMEKFGEKVDGVVAVDPIALAYILKATGPVKLANGSSIKSSNAVDLLLNRVYLDQPDNVTQDAFFAEAAAKTFDAVASGKAKPPAIIAAMNKASSENRLLVWSHDKSNQAVLAPTRVAGTLTGDSGSTPHVGVYLNDATATKLEYYVDVTTTMYADTCTNDDIQTMRTTTVFESNVPKKAAGLPKSITGPTSDAQRGIMSMNLRVYAPYGGLITEVTLDDEFQTIVTASHNKRNVNVVPVRVKPGQRVTVQTTMVSGRDQPDDPILSATPTIKSVPNNVAVASACNR